MNNNAKFELAICAIDQLLAALAAEQATAIPERDTMAADDNLESVAAELQRRREQIIKRCLPPPNMRYRTLTRQVLESWRLGATLGNKIATFEAMFEKL